MNGLFPLRDGTPMTVRSQGRTIAGAIVREPTSLRTGRALTAASHRKCGRQGEQTGEVRRKPGTASHHETYLLRVLAYLQEYDIILSEP